MVMTSPAYAVTGVAVSISVDAPATASKLMLFVAPAVKTVTASLTTAFCHDLRMLKDTGLRELVILLVAVLNRAPYEFVQHAPVALAEGVPQSKVDAVGTWQTSSLFTQQVRDVLAYAQAMTLTVQVPDAVFAAARAHFSDREMVELTATVAAYNMVSRFLEALQIEPETTA